MWAIASVIFYSITEGLHARSMLIRFPRNIRGNQPLLNGFKAFLSVDKVTTNGKLIASKIDEVATTSTGSNGAKVESKVTVSPYVTILTEPILEFSASMATIKSKEKRKLLAETVNGLAYEGVAGTQARGVIYIFENGKLQLAGLLFYNAGATVQTSATLIKERYADGVTADGQVVIVNDERTFGLVLGGDNTFEYMGIFILYPLGGRLNAERTAAKQATTAFLSALPD